MLRGVQASVINVGDWCLRKSAVNESAIKQRNTRVRWHYIRRIDNA